MKPEHTKFYGYIISFLLSIIYVQYGKPSVNIESFCIGAICFIIPLLSFYLISTSQQIKEIPNQILTDINEDDSEIRPKWRLRNNIKRLLSTINDVLIKDRHHCYTDTINYVISRLAKNIKGEFYIGEIDFYLQIVENALLSRINFISKTKNILLGEKVEVFATSLLKPSEWEKGLDAEGNFKNQFKKYKNIFERQEKYIDLTRVIILTEEEFINPNEKEILNTFIKDHEKHQMKLLYCDKKKLNNTGYTEYEKDFVLIGKKENAMVFFIDQIKLSRYIPIKFHDSKSTDFHIFNDAKEYYEDPDGISVSAREKFNEVFPNEFK